MKKHSTIFLGLLLCASHFTHCSGEYDPDLEFSSRERGEFELRRARLGMEQEARDGNRMSDGYAIALVFADHQRKLNEEARKAALAKLTMIKKTFDECFPAEFFGDASKDEVIAPTVIAAKEAAIAPIVKDVRRRRADSCDEYYYEQAEEKGDDRGDPELFYGKRSPIPKKKTRKCFLDCLKGKLGLSSKDKNK
jgi:hypothetical protein